jgi:hypothetical protein
MDMSKSMEEDRYWSTASSGAAGGGGRGSGIGTVIGPGWIKPESGGVVML